mmetsp:Transcript_18630/g.33669  ORF Transcript_18630/g.33669 Transcript_18630/m.33669 type:complete len:1015 (+) Transcript_18630:2-3046(+)
MESVNVIIRFRGGERGNPAEFAPFTITPTTIRLEGRDHTYSFDAILRSDQSQEELYRHAAEKIITNFLEGFNATIFAYGQSGSGKTFSMLGPEEVTEVFVNRREVEDSVQQMFGIIPRATQQIFNIVNEGIKLGTEYSIKCSYIEIYNEKINDILCYPVAENLNIREFPKLGMCVMGMTERFITQPEEVFDCLSAGTANRIVCSTGQNARSSRSHTVFVIVIEQKLADGSTKISKLNLVDLAGSEKLANTGAEGKALIEAQNINLSLTTLGMCIKALTSAKKKHIPFRDSKLTLILKESLGGNSQTSLLCTASGKLIYKNETLGTFAFAERAKQIKNKATSNVTRSAEELMQMVEQLKAEVTSLRKKMKSMAENPGVPISDAPEEAEASEASISTVATVADEELHFRLTELQVQYERFQESSNKEIERLQFELERAAQLTVDPLTVRELEDEIIELKGEKKKIEDDSEKVRFQLQTQVDELTTTIQENASILFNYQEELKSYEGKLSEVKTSLLEKEAQLHQTVEVKELLENELKGRQAELANMRTEMHSLVENTERLEIHLSSLKQQIATKDQHLNSLHETLLTKEGELSLLKLEEAKLKSSLHQAEQDKAANEGKYEDQKAQNEALRVEIEALTTRLQEEQDSHAKEKSEMQSHIDEGARELALVKNKVQALELEVQENKLTHEQIEEREDLISKLRESHEAELKKLSVEHEELRVNYEESVLALQNKLNDQKISYEELKIKAEADLREENRRFEALESANQALAQQNAEIEFAMKKLNQELSTAHTLISSQTESMKQQKIEHDAMLKSSRDLMMKHSISLQTAKAISASHSKKLEEVYRELADTKAEVNSVRFNGQKELGQAQEEAEKLNIEIKKLKSQISIREGTIEELRKKSNELEGKLGSKDLQMKQISDDKRRDSIKATLAVPDKPSYPRRGSIKPKVNPWGVSLKPVGNGLLDSARKEAISSALQSASSVYKVDYGIDSIKLLYANTEAIERETIEAQQQEESKAR